MGGFIRLLSLLYLGANKTFRILEANVFMQLVYGTYNVVHIRTQVKSTNCVLFLVDGTFWENQLPTWKWMCKGKHPY